MSETKEKTKLSVGMFLMIILLACNMRACYTGVGTIISLIQADLHLNGTLAGMITTIPLIVFAVVCPLSSAICGKYGIGRMIAAALVLVGAGTVLRAFFGAAGLFGGTVILSVGAGIMNALMVGLIKLRFPEHNGVVTSAYTTTMAVTTALALMVNVPVSGVIGWRGDMAMWAVITVVSIVLWFPQAGQEKNRGSARSGESGTMGKLLRSPKAWYLSLYMGSQSLLFYSITAWMPTILQSRGMSIESAANAATVLQMTSLPTTLLVPIIAERIPMRRLTTLLNGAYIIGALLFYFCALNSAGMWLGIVMIAMGMGTGFSACIFLFSKKTHTPAQTAALSGFAQSSGYVLAAVGPVLMGALFDLSGAWNLPMCFCFLILLLMSFCAFRGSKYDYIL